jgi:hypothetical protein
MDDDGELEEYEFLCGLALLTRSGVESRLKSLFYCFDRDQNQVIDSDEFETMVRCLMLSNLGSQINKSQIAAKASDLKGAFFIRENSVPLQKFVSMCLTDADLKAALKNLGILSPTESEAGTGLSHIDKELKKMEKSKGPTKLEKAAGVPAEDAPAETEGGFTEEKVDGGDQFMATKAFAGTVKNSVPSEYKPSKADGQTPDTSLKLEYVHGFRCWDTRNNIYYNPEGRLVYHTAELGIRLDTETNKQDFVLENHDDIMSFDTFQNLSATGEIGNKPVLCLWDNVTMTKVCSLVGVLRKGISQICFSHDGKQLAASSMDSDNTIMIFSVDQMKSGQKESMSRANFRECSGEDQRPSRGCPLYEVRQR